MTVERLLNSIGKECNYKDGHHNQLDKNDSKVIWIPLGYVIGCQPMSRKYCLPMYLTEIEQRLFHQI